MWNSFSQLFVGFDCQIAINELFLFLRRFTNLGGIDFKIIQFSSRKQKHAKDSLRK